LSNPGGATAHGVVAVTNVYVGDEVIWSDRESFGDLGTGESVSVEKRVEVGYLEAAKVKMNGGVIRFETIVSSREETVVFGDIVKVT